MMRFSILMLALLFAVYSQFKASENVRTIKTKGDRMEKLSKELGYVVVEKLTGMKTECKQLHDHTMPMLGASKSDNTLVCFQEPDGERIETIISQTLFDELVKPKK